MRLLETLLPIFLTILLGMGLARWRFLGREFIADLNRLIFFVSLPALAFRSIASTPLPPVEYLRLGLLLLTCTVLAMGVAYGLAKIFKVRRESIGTLLQAAFRGNLAYIAIPVLGYSFIDVDPSRRTELLGGSMLLLGALSTAYNFLAVLCLANPGGRGVWRGTLLAIARNPIILACAAGLAVSALRFPVPVPIDRTLDIVGAAALPVALLCVGGSFVGIRFHGRHRSIWIATAVKIAVLPLLAWIGCRLMGVTGLEERVVLVMAAAPTAITAYTMTAQMDGDADVASGAIGLSTLLSFGSLAVIWLLT